MPFVNSCLNLATLTLWFWHLCRGLIDRAPSARVEKYRLQKSLHWPGLDELVLFLQRRCLVLSLWAKFSLAGVPPDSGESPPSCPVQWRLGCTSGEFLFLSVPNPLLILRCVWMRTWRMCWLGDLPPNRFCLPALGQVAGVCLWIQPELKGCVDLALGQLCASQIFSFPSDNLSVVSSLTTTKCLFYSHTKLGLSQKFCVFLPSGVADVRVLTRWPCDQGLDAAITVPWLSGDFFLYLLCWVNRLLALCLLFQLSKWSFGGFI